MGAARVTPPPVSIQALVQQGLVLQQQGRLQDASRCYDAVLRADPANFDALHLLGTILIQVGQAERGVGLVRRAIERDGTIAAAHCTLGSGLVGLKRFEPALAAFDQAITLEPRNAPAHNNRGLVLSELGRLDQALASFDRAIALNPAYALAHNNRGRTLRALQRALEAMASLDRALELNPRLVEAHYNRGLVLGDLNQPHAALACFRRAIELNPQHGLAHDSLGSTLSALGQFEAALISFERAIAVTPGYCVAHLHRGQALNELGRHMQALASFDAALALDRANAEVHCGRALALGALQRPREALASLDVAIDLDPRAVEAHTNRGSALHELGLYSEALASFDRAIALDADCAGAMANAGYTRLLLGRLEVGWRLHEHRPRRWDANDPRFSRQRQWAGQDLAPGERLYLHYEQGLGDTIQFVRYAKALEDRGLACSLGVQSALAPLIKTMGLSGEILADDAVPDHFDYHCPLLSLPLAFATTLDTIPWNGPYLWADRGRRAGFEVRLGARSRPRIGIAWSGNPAHKNDANRSIAFAQLVPLFEADCDWICLQNMIRPGDMAAFDASGRVGFHGEALEMFDATAALLDLMDLVITVDTSIAHLAGAMGKPVWVMTPFIPDWRWLLDRRDSPWYPSARLFRQSQIGDWSKVLEEVGAELRALIN